MPLTNAEKKARSRSNKEAQGMVRLNIDYVWPQQKADFKLVLEGKAKIVRIDPLNEYDGRVY